MPGFAILFGSLLAALGATAYFATDLLGEGKTGQISSLSPAFIGIPIILAGLIALNGPGFRKHAMHAAAVLALLGTVGGIVPVILRNLDINTAAVKVGLGMMLLSAIFLGLCVKSFIDAKKARKLAEAKAAEAS